ncbi:beta-ketoacyl synthase N-terminal-like domain-containing protein [Phenylobacterium sp.]|uniref:beta-ketoacyl synthase N-terminal-like domain-containing protein n=1 Tax=Phenylobacterium sp. TaxID=1871053 RepID=UPI0025DDFBC8|nr:beta-ketoacyl synthase N-terminal-like domain-containing protein [Phenylobacterium sp.]MCA6288063.1 beta-ketoacyl-ACP synthase [Phenylobacterium sp.]MCA6346656.1 beta-ketoacyl-ACP synthase [Phenylobacterium sp.]MCA6349252.1 beta-ketoacyl-ACP synthase [Phenylobacterium sp.]MCA6352214.1 beta-ketoacyl-ACP synthase [Phenylobacterium sp.]MCA6355567.1 beta-ketoacyl-ACP synthase [Phenylobacterium sp.]
MTGGATKKVAVTGVGLVTALGADVASCWAAAVAGRSGVRVIERFPTDQLPVRIAACVETFDGGISLDQDRTLAMARRALREALAQSGQTGRDRSSARLFVAAPQPEVDWRARWLAQDGERLIGADTPDSVLEQLSASADGAYVANVLTRDLGFGPPPLTVTTACASGASAIQLAADEIRSGRLETAVVVAADSTVSVEGLLRFALLSALSTRQGAPERASRPFSADRDGFVMGEGAAALVLESPARAAQRGAAALAMLVGCGDATDTYHRTRSHPSGDAIVASMAGALRDAGMSPDAVDHINAHGTGTVENDKMEALAIGRLFGARGATIPVTANKSLIGHTLSAAGAVEAVFSILSLMHGRLPPTLNYDHPDPDIPLDVVAGASRTADLRLVLSNAFGFGGQNVTLAFQRSDVA